MPINGNASTSAPHLRAGRGASGIGSARSLHSDSTGVGPRRRRSFSRGSEGKSSGRRRDPFSERAARHVSAEARRYRVAPTWAGRPVPAGTARHAPLFKTRSGHEVDGPWARLKARHVSKVKTSGSFKWASTEGTLAIGVGDFHLYTETLRLWALAMYRTAYRRPKWGPDADWWTEIDP